jgi:sigma-B regulation protein RsbU (phosphoserine phosphatase)
VGLNCDEVYTTTNVLLQPDDLLVLATDGLTEARDQSGRLLNEDGALRWVSETKASNAQAVADDLVRRLRRFVASRSLEDDLALVVVRFRPPGVVAVSP